MFYIQMSSDITFLFHRSSMALVVGIWYNVHFCPGVRFVAVCATFVSGELTCTTSVINSLDPPMLIETTIGIAIYALSVAI